MSNNNEMSKNVTTVKKISAYIENLFNDLKTEELELNTKDKIDCYTFLNEIKKNIDEYLKVHKKELPFKINKDNEAELEGNYCRAEYAVKEELTVEPLALLKEVKKENFIHCVCVSNTEAKKYVPENRLKEIGTIKITPVITLKVKK